MPENKLTRTRTAKLTLSPRRLKVMHQRVLNKVSGGHSYFDSLAKVIAKNKLEGGDLFVLTRTVFQLAVRRRQLTRRQAREQLAEVLGGNA